MLADFTDAPAAGSISLRVTTCGLSPHCNYACLNDCLDEDKKEEDWADDLIPATQPCRHGQTPVIAFLYIWCPALRGTKCWHISGPDRLLEARNSCAAYFPIGNLHYCAFGRLRAFQLACLFWMPAMIAAAWLVEV